MPFTILAVAFLVLVLLIARRAQESQAMRSGLYALLALINLGLFLTYGLAPALNLVRGPAIPRDRGLLLLGLAAVFAGFGIGLLQLPVRLRLRRIFSPAYDPHSLPQMVALNLCLLLLADSTLSFILQGGLSGLAESFQGVTVGSTVIQAAIFVAIAFAGVGYPLKRNLPAALARLGLRAPSIEELSIGFLTGSGLVICAFSVGVLWTILTPPDTLEQQTQVSRLIALSVDTVSLSFVVAACAAVGEEIAFRGALQPIVGLWPAAIFFAMTHIQYTLTPATVLIIIVGVGFGWLRRRYNTTVAIVAHFTYDFALLFLSVYGRYLQDVFKL
jgi:hypothetical protein